jgi:TatD DNase family protein
MQLIDTHCHLDVEPLGRDTAGVLARARAAGVEQIVAPAYDVASWPVVAALADGGRIFPALGLHPWVAHEELDLQRLKKALLDCGAVAVGEIGLDSKIDSPSLDVQIPAFRSQLRLARELDLPVILHCRGAFAEMLAILQEEGPELRGVAHAFSRGPELAQRFLDLGLHLGFGGAVTRPRARRPRRSAEVVPLESIVLETDAPSIGLEGVVPEHVEPRHVVDVAVALAELRGLTLDTLAEATTKHARELFRLPAFP